MYVDVIIKPQAAAECLWASIISKVGNKRNYSPSLFFPSPIPPCSFYPSLLSLSLCIPGVGKKDMSKLFEPA